MCMCWGHLILMQCLMENIDSGLAESLGLLLYIIFSLYLFTLYALPASAILSLFPVGERHDKDVGVDIPKRNK